MAVSNWNDKIYLATKSAAGPDFQLNLLRRLAGFLSGVMVRSYESALK